jgi:hypothetical protein
MGQRHARTPGSSGARWRPLDPAAAPRRTWGLCRRRRARHFGHDPGRLRAGDHRQCMRAFVRAFVRAGGLGVPARASTHTGRAGRFAPRPAPHLFLQVLPVGAPHGGDAAQDRGKAGQGQARAREAVGGRVIGAAVKWLRGGPGRGATSRRRRRALPVRRGAAVGACTMARPPPGHLGVPLGRRRGPGRCWCGRLSSARYRLYTHT